MKIKIFGAAGGEVTGSSYMVQTKHARILVDAGMFQGGKTAESRNKVPQGTRAHDFDAVLLTHGHLDHTGRVPLLIKFGFDNPVYATQATIDLAQIILKDSARLQVADSIRKNKRLWKPGMPSFEPLYSVEHVDQMMQMVKPAILNHPVAISEDITARWIPAGHMLGSGSIELKVRENGKEKVIVFSGDLGPLNMPLLKPFETISQADLVFLESTYGDRDHKSLKDTLIEFQEILNEAVRNKGKILVPTFAIGRAQQIAYHLGEMFFNKSVKPFPVYIDSPMALEATQVYQHNFGLLDEEFHALVNKGVFPLDPAYFIPSPTAEDSKKLNDIEGPALIMAGAGMCNGGRILHHLLHNLEDPKCTVVIVGFQSEGSLGRRLVDGDKFVKLFGERLKVRASIRTLGGFSAHAGQTDLLTWFGAMAPSKPRVVITHGEDGPRQALASMIKKKFRLNSVLPKIGDVVEL